MKSSPSTNSVWVENENDEKPCFLGMVQVYTDTTASTLEANAMVAYAVHVKLQNFTYEFRRNLIDHGHPFAGLLHVCTAAQVDCVEGGEDENEDVGRVVSLSARLSSTYDIDGRDAKLYVLHKAMEMIL